MPRNFSRAIKRDAYERSKDQHGTARCVRCTTPLRTGHIIYDHRIPWAISRDSSLANCDPICSTCDRLKTHVVDQPEIASVKRRGDRHIGAIRLGFGRQRLPCGRSSTRTKTFRHGVRPRLTQGQKLRQTLDARRLR
jgi:5-methylcytosine-specific restriction protein A